ncbi:MAG TPA: hypothetical protein VFM88_05955 [Vicinamibacteria bacterium]|nr:hypothetical protein [Vicinamibacteria bacterium]
MASAEQVLLRQRLCRAEACGAVFYLCGRCDHGQRYCSERCREKARREQRRAANRRHQQSPEGRLDHRDRQREYRRRLIARRVTDQGSNAAIGFSTLAAPTPAPLVRCGNEVLCRICGSVGVLIDPFCG